MGVNDSVSEIEQVVLVGLVNLLGDEETYSFRVNK